MKMSFKNFAYTKKTCLVYSKQIFLIFFSTLFLLIAIKCLVFLSCFVSLIFILTTKLNHFNRCYYFFYNGWRQTQLQCTFFLHLIFLSPLYNYKLFVKCCICFSIIIIISHQFFLKSSHTHLTIVQKKKNWICSITEVFFLNHCQTNSWKKEKVFMKTIYYLVYL